MGVGVRTKRRGGSSVARALAVSDVGTWTWHIADDVLRGALNRTKYRDVILPMTVIRRLDALLEDTREHHRQQKDLETGQPLDRLEHDHGQTGGGTRYR